MSEIYLTAAAGVHFLVVANLTTAHGTLNTFLFKVYPTILAFGLLAIATAKFMGWPL